MTQKFGLGMLHPFQLKISIFINLFYFKIPAGYENIPDSNWSTCDSWPTLLLVAVSCRPTMSQIMMSVSLNFFDKAPKIITFKFQILNLFFAVLCHFIVQKMRLVGQELMLFRCWLNLYFLVAKFW